MSEAFLVADIGGTNARFALATFDGRKVTVRDVQSFLAEDFETIRDAADAYIEAVRQKPKVACFAIAAPITEDVIDFTNSPWVLNIPKTKKALGFDDLIVANDFEALASGVLHLSEEDFISVKGGEGDPKTSMIVLGPGTGLGQSLMVPTPNGGRLVIPTEGGHVGFSPSTSEEMEVMKFIAREHPRVSVERILSGRGLVNLHRALCVISGTARVSLQAREITEAALTKEYPIAVKAVDMFCAILGGVAGDAVLCTGARAKVFLGGGILPKIKDIFLKSAFVDRFLDKGRMRGYVESVPVDLIVGEGAALTGAAAILKERHHAN